MNGVNGENVNERLDEAIKELGLTVRGFSIKTGIDNSNLAKKLQGKLGITKNDIRVVNYPQAKDSWVVHCLTLILLLILSSYLRHVS